MGIPAQVSQTPPSGDRATSVVSGAFAATGVSAPFMFWGPFNVVLYGAGGPNGNWTGTVRLERSFDGGLTWVVCGIGGSGTQAIWTSAGTGADISVVAAEPERGVLYRLNCSAYTAGTINYRMSGDAQAMLSLAVTSVV